MTDLSIAAFVARALDLEDDPAALAAELVALKRDANAGISSLELESSVGPAAFLVYHYLLEVSDAEGRSGQALFEADLATLERAAEHDTPGPRIVAHALAGDAAFILATTPATYRLLTGAEPADALEASEAHLLPGPETERARRAAATDLLALLRDADAHAGAWLRAIQAEGRLSTSAEEPADLIAFTEEETALALFLLDDRSIRNLLQLLNVILGSARRQTAAATNGEI